MEMGVCDQAQRNMVFPLGYQLLFIYLRVCAYR